jgi:hypothetical protein
MAMTPMTDTARVSSRLVNRIFGFFIVRGRDAVPMMKD